MAVSGRHPKMDHEKVSELEKILENGTQKGIIERKSEVSVERKTAFSPFTKQALISFSSVLMTISAGATAGYSAILIPQLRNEKGEQGYSLEMVSWLASMASFALIFGNIISGYLMEELGRKRSQIAVSICLTFGWAIIAFSNDIIGLILAGRFITGVGQGWLGSLSSIFVGEISSPEYRGLFLAGLSLGIAAGIFLVHLFGTFLRWNITALIIAIFPMISCIIITFYAPESPVWLASQNRIEECIKSFHWYRGTSPAMKSELDKMILEQSKKDHSQSKLEALSKNIKKPEFWKPLTIMMAFFLITQLTGVNVISAYTTDIMTGLMGSDSNSSNAYLAMLSVDVLRCMSLVIACFIFRSYGRRPLGILSSLFTALSLIALALYLYLGKIDVIKHMSPVVTLGLMAVYMIVCNIGIYPLPWNMVGEVFASETKGLGSGISVMVTSIAFFGVVKTAPYLFEMVGSHGTYLFYGVSTLLGTVFLYFYLPETKDKTLLQIEEYFRDGKKNNLEEKKKVNNKPLLTKV